MCFLRPLLFGTQRFQIPAVSVNDTCPRRVTLKNRFVLLFAPSRLRLTSMWLCRLQIVIFCLAARLKASIHLTIFGPASSTDGADTTHVRQLVLMMSKK